MVKQKRIMGWLIISIMIMLIGVNNVLASEYSIKDLQIKGYDNTGTSLTAATTSCYEAEEKCEIQLTTVAGSYGGAIGIQSPIPILPNHSYAISLKIYINTNANIALSKKNRIALGSSLGSLKYSYETEQYGNSLTYSTVNNDMLQFVISSYSENAESYLLIPFTTNTTTTAIFTVTSIAIEDLGENNLTQEQIDSSLNNQTNDLINNQNQNTQDIIDSNKETQDVIKDQFNSCRPSNNLFNPANVVSGYTNDTNGNITGNGISTGYIEIKSNTNYYILSNKLSGNWGAWYDENKNYISGFSLFNNIDGIFKSPSNAKYISFTVSYANNNPDYSTNVMIAESSVKIDYEPYGEEICTNKLDEQVETSKGIWGTIKDLPNAFMNMLKGLFIPDDGYFENWFNDLKLFFEEKLGFLVTPFTIVIDFVNRYLSLDPNKDIIINIPDITVPNFEDHIIVSATTFNWSELLKSKESLNILWELYLSFVDVFLILNFIGLCENKYNRIFGGDTTPYEYYTIEDSYMFDTDTGEITKMGVHKEKRTTRKKVN